MSMTKSVEEMLYNIARERDRLLKETKNEKSADFIEGYFNGALDAFNLFKKELEG